MQKSKLMEAIRALEEAERASFRRFAASPYFNENEELLQLLDYILSFEPAFEEEGLSKEAAFRSLFPGQPYEDKRMRYLMSGLNKLLEEFLVINRYREQENRRLLGMMEISTERGLEKAYRQSQRQLIQLLEEAPHRGEEYFFEQMRRGEIEERHFQLQRLRQYDASIEHASDYLDRHYFLQKLRYACIMLDRQAILKGHYSLNISQEWMTHLQAQNFFNEPIISLYFTILQALLEEEEEAYFQALKKNLAEAGPGIPPDNMQDIYLFAINYCARKIRKGRDDYGPEALRLYMAGIESGVLINAGQLSPWAFTNVVKLALRLKRYSWIERFIPKYAPLLPEAFRENALHYNLAELYYYTQRFKQAQEHLIQVAYSDLNYYLGARVLLAKIYFETDATEPLLSLIAAFTIFLKRNKQLSGELKETYLNFCELLYQIVRRKPARMKKLGRQIAGTPLLTDRAWLQSAYEQAAVQSSSGSS